MTGTGEYVVTRRLAAQRWLLDATIRTVGVDWDQGRTRSAQRPCGLAADGDFARVRSRVKRFSDIHREFAQAARSREQRAERARAAGHRVESREHWFIASMLWGCAEWPLFGHTDLSAHYTERKLACFAEYIAVCAHPIRRVEIPLGEQTLPGYLHLPRQVDAPYPCVLSIGGMDGFKEKRVAMYGDELLERGIAQLVVEIPGQGEALARGMPMTQDSTAAAGRAIGQWIRQQPELDADRIAVSGTSFGSFWSLVIASTGDPFAACAVAGVVHEPGMHTLRESASPTFKARFMYMCGFTDEDEFDAFAAKLDLRPYAERLGCPHLVVAGEDDELSPIRHTFELLPHIKSPVSLVLYEGEKHSAGGASSSTQGPNRNHLIADWLVDRLAGRTAADSYSYVDARGQVQEREPVWR
ncbi:MAG: alpha/beta hydrolase [Micromonosporaceae bacterium]|nr:alpha/beta hydrolase [Micromonosporaceae bacterium]